ncbi:MAG TPA: neutral zinc metallopeptidase [Acidimicrobiia bacterium]|nr:neutral zinc metallopeptidase [Acidimicrobiia bacterium]
MVALVAVFVVIAAWPLVAVQRVAFAATGSSDLAQRVIDDVQAFWAEELPAVYGHQYQSIPQERLHPYTSSNPPPACGSTGTTPYKDVAGNAFYCPDGDFVAWDAEGLIPKLQQQYGDLAVALVFAHEWGHVIQQQTGTSASSTIPLELQADCFAGAWTNHATKTKSDTFNLKPGELDQALSGYLYFRDPTGTSPAQQGAHGSAFDRISAFNDGFTGGAKQCKNYETSPPIVTEIPFTSSSDQARQGDLPFADLLPLVRRDLDDYWKSVMGSTPATKLVSGAAKAKRCAGTDTRPVAACPDGTVAYDPKALEALYTEHGDYAVATLMAEAWADAARLRGKLRVAAAPSRRAAECMAGAWAGNLVDGTRKTDATLSPGDLDEAVSALLAYPGAKTPGNDGFVRFRAFREGFLDGAPACGLTTKQ